MDSKTVINMIISAAGNLRINKDEIDRLNVFPVPDGDTGKNMSMTMDGAAAAAASLEDLPPIKIFEKVASATLKSARGNSGVIMSQLFRGIAKGLAEKGDINGETFAYALKNGAHTAYNAVMKPTEGTILTVARESAEAAEKAAKENSDIKYVTEQALMSGRVSLEKTKEILPKLKEANVVDSGGMGWICVLEGMYHALCGNVMEESAFISESSKEPVSAASSEEITFGYCTEFIIEKYDEQKNANHLRDVISKIGDCMLVVEDYDVIKVHIHTNNPGIVLEEAVKLGSLINIKIDNMRYQHNENLKLEAKEKTEVKPKRKYAIIAVSAGKGFDEIFRQIGVTDIIEGGQTMNPSAGDIAEAVERANAEEVFVLPNNKNIILASNQARQLVKCHVIPTQTVPQGISAAIAYNPEETVENNTSAMAEAAESVRTGNVTYAVRDSESNGITIKKDDIMSVCDTGIVYSGPSVDEAVFEILDTACTDDSGLITLYYGDDVEKSDAETLYKKVEEKYPDIDVSLEYGGQPVYYYVISVE